MERQQGAVRASINEDSKMQHPDNPAIMMLDSKPAEVVRFTSVGGYPVFYVTDDSGVLCATCVQEEIESCCDHDSGGWYVESHVINWEDPDLDCDNCSARIESAYAKPDDQ